MDYYETATNGDLFIVPLVRSLREVIFEREIVAEYFEDNRVLSGVCDLFKAQVMIESKGLDYSELQTPINLELQHSIDVYNFVTAEDVIRQYEKDMAP